MTEELPVIDLDLGAKLLSSDKQVAKDMILKLIAMLPESVQDLNAAFAAEDIKKIGAVAHYVHGGSCYCGTPRLKAAALALEKSAKTAQSLQDLQAAYQNLCEEIQRVIAEGNHI